MSVTDQEQALRAQFVKEICEARRVRLFVKFPDEFERLFVNERAVIREPGNPAKKMKDHAVGRAGIIAWEVCGNGVWRISENVIRR